MSRYKVLKTVSGAVSTQHKSAFNQYFLGIPSLKCRYVLFEEVKILK